MMKRMSSKETNVHYSRIYHLVFAKKEKILLILQTSMAQTKKKEKNKKKDDGRGGRDMTEGQRFLASKKCLFFLGTVSFLSLYVPKA